MLLAVVLIVFFGIMFGTVLNPMFWSMFQNAKYLDELDKQIKEYEDEIRKV